MNRIKWSCIVVAGLTMGCGTTTTSTGGASRPIASQPAQHGPSDTSSQSTSMPRPAARQVAGQHAKAPVFRQAGKEQRIKTPSGATFLVPARWYLGKSAGAFVLQDPEKDVLVALVETAAPNVRTAVSKAWKLVRPGFGLKMKHVVTPPSSGGWDQVSQIGYEVSDTQHRIVFALARRKGALWYVALLDGSQKGFSRRGAQAVTIVKSVKVAGVREENFGGRKAHRLDVQRLHAFATFFDEARKRLEIPGAAVAIVQGGKVVYKKGFGVRLLGGQRPVTTKTLFMIGSTTKSLTTLMMARLVDKGLFSWQTPVTKVLPSFALGDAKLTRECQMRHTVCACTGMPRQDMEFIFQYDGVTPEERVAFMKTMKPTTGFGETFQYSNMMVALGGFAAAHALYPKRKLGPAYDRAMSRLVFRPLGMKRTTFDYRRASRRDHAMPHAMGLDGAYHHIPIHAELGVYPIRPAGAAWSNVEDMTRFLLLELGKGRLPNGKQVVSEQNLLMRRKPQIRILPKLFYGLGLMIRTEYGVRVVQHDGNNLGFTTGMFFLPDQDVGVIILTNRGSANSLAKLAKRRLFEVLFDAKQKAASLLAFVVKQEKKSLADFTKKLNLHPDAAWLSQVGGCYQNASLGVIRIGGPTDAAWLNVGEWRAPIAQKREAHGPAWIITGEPVTGLAFQPGRAQGRKTLTFAVAQKKYVFVQTPCHTK
ncbi:MAG: beta-lactamase family protein [Deltaproteobacteria bacterium]|nr:beta-lactamase family protein [Deltaproteobacteria bacterium]